MYFGESSGNNFEREPSFGSAESQPEVPEMNQDLLTDAQKAEIEEATQKLQSAEDSLDGARDEIYYQSVGVSSENLGSMDFEDRKAALEVTMGGATNEATSDYEIDQLTKNQIYAEKDSQAISVDSETSTDMGEAGDQLSERSHEGQAAEVDAAIMDSINAQVNINEIQQQNRQRMQAAQEQVDLARREVQGVLDEIASEQTDQSTINQFSQGFEAMINKDEILATAIAEGTDRQVEARTDDTLEAAVSRGIDRQVEASINQQIEANFYHAKPIAEEQTPDGLEVDMSDVSQLGANLDQDEATWTSK